MDDMGPARLAIRRVAEVGADRDPSALHLALVPQKRAFAAEYDVHVLVVRDVSQNWDGGRPHPHQVASAPESQDNPVRPAHSVRRGSPDPAKWPTEGLPSWRTGRFGLLEAIREAPGQMP
jgi:hypothetical protein